MSYNTLEKTIKNHIKFGSMKLPKSTMVFNMGSAKDCPSKTLGFCLVVDKCYARKDEKLYKSVLPYRERQEKIWLTHTASEFCAALTAILRRKRTQVKLFRLNESGDFHSQECVIKAEQIAEHLFEKHGIRTYTYTARKDLDFSNCKYLKVKGSGHNKGNNGSTMVLMKGDVKPEGFIRCPGSCKTCSACSFPKMINIAFNVH